MMYIPGELKYCPDCDDMGVYTIDHWWGQEPIICHCPLGMFYEKIEQELWEEERREVMDHMSAPGSFL